MIVSPVDTISEADAVLPVPPLPDVTAPVTLFFKPPVLPVTSTANVQDAFAASDPPARLTVPAPAVAVIVPPPHDPVRPFGVDTTRPAGNVSLNAMPVSAVALFGLVTVKVNVVLPLSAIDGVPNAFAIVGGATTVNVAVASALLPPSVDVAVTLLFFTPAVVPVTLTLKVHEAAGVRRRRSSDGAGPGDGGDGAAATRSGEAVRRRNHHACGQRIGEADPGERPDSRVRVVEVERQRRRAAHRNRGRQECLRQIGRARSPLRPSRLH